MSHTITTSFRTVTPAYGRDYKNKHDALADFTSGKDFVLQPETQYCSVRDFAPGVTVIIRYKKQTQTTTYVIP